MTILEQETMNAVKNYCNSKPNIDWEQRRYEIAKEVFLCFKNSLNPCKENAKRAVEIADLLIAELKKEKQ